MRRDSEATAIAAPGHGVFALPLLMAAPGREHRSQCGLRKMEHQRWHANNLSDCDSRSLDLIRTTVELTALLEMRGGGQLECNPKRKMLTLPTEAASRRIPQEEQKPDVR